MKKTFKVALLILILVLAWIVVGVVAPGDSSNKKDNKGNVIANKEKVVPKVRIKDSKAITRPKVLDLIGITKFSKEVEIKAEVSGKVDKILAEEGKLIKKGDVILIVEKRNRQAKLDELEAKYEQKKIKYESSKKLSASGLQSKSRLAESKSEMESARAGLIQAQIDYGNTVIKSPFTGILEQVNVEVGDYLQLGFGGSSEGLGGGSSAIAKIIDNTPYIVEVGISERIIGQLKEGTEAKVKLVDGSEAQGVVTYISKIANPKTRSFKIEVTVDDEKGAPSGVTAEVKLMLGKEVAHKVPSSSLALDKDGRFGVKILAADTQNSSDNNNVKGVVKFHPIKVYDSESDGVWITGLEEDIKLITLGGAFVEIGAQAIGIYKE